MQIKPHDTVVALGWGCLARRIYEWELGHEKTVSLTNDSKAFIYTGIRGFAGSLGLSPGEVSKSCQRLLKARLIIPNPNEGGFPSYFSATGALREWLSYGIQYCIIPEPQGVGRGVPTAWSNPDVKSDLVPRDIPHVWLLPGGDITGEGVSPLYPNAPVAAAKDRNLHYILSLIDAVRLAKPRELKIARELITEYLGLINAAQVYNAKQRTS